MDNFQWIIPLANIFVCSLSFLMICTGISYIIDSFKKTSYYRYDSADFLDDEDIMDPPK